MATFVDSDETTSEEETVFTPDILGKLALFIAPAEKYFVKAGVSTIGRSSRSDIRLPYKGISRNHASLITEGKESHILRNTSKEIIYVDGIKVLPGSCTQLVTGAKIKLSNVCCYYVICNFRDNDKASENLPYQTVCDTDFYDMPTQPFHPETNKESVARRTIVIGIHDDNSNIPDDIYDMPTQVFQFNEKQSEADKGASIYVTGDSLSECIRAPRVIKDLPEKSSWANEKEDGKDKETSEEVDESIHDMITQPFVLTHDKSISNALEQSTLRSPGNNNVYDFHDMPTQPFDFKSRCSSSPADDRNSANENNQAQSEIPGCRDLNTSNDLFDEDEVSIIVPDSCRKQLEANTEANRKNIAISGECLTAGENISESEDSSDSFTLLNELSEYTSSNVFRHEGTIELKHSDLNSVGVSNNYKYANQRESDQKNEPPIYILENKELSINSNSWRCCRAMEKTCVENSQSHENPEFFMDSQQKFNQDVSSCGTDQLLHLNDQNRKVTEELESDIETSEIHPINVKKILGDAPNCHKTLPYDIPCSNVGIMDISVSIKTDAQSLNLTTKQKSDDLNSFVEMQNKGHYSESNESQCANDPSIITTSLEVPILIDQSEASKSLKSHKMLLTNTGIMISQSANEDVTDKLENNCISAGLDLSMNTVDLLSVSDGNAKKLTAVNTNKKFDESIVPHENNLPSQIPLEKASTFGREINDAIDTNNSENCKEKTMLLTTSKTQKNQKKKREFEEKRAKFGEEKIDMPRSNYDFNDSSSEEKAVSRTTVSRSCKSNKSKFPCENVDDSSYPEKGQKSLRNRGSLQNNYSTAIDNSSIKKKLTEISERKKKSNNSKVSIDFEILSEEKSGRFSTAGRRKKQKLTDSETLNYSIGETYSKTAPKLSSVGKRKQNFDGSKSLNVGIKHSIDSIENSMPQEKLSTISTRKKKSDKLRSSQGIVENSIFKEAAEPSSTEYETKLNHLSPKDESKNISTRRKRYKLDKPKTDVREDLQENVIPTKLAISNKTKLRIDYTSISNSFENSKAISPNMRKRKLDSSVLSSDMKNSSANNEPVRNLRKRLRSEEGMKIMLTGITCTPNLERCINKSGGMLVDSHFKADVLVTDKIRRTAKFLCMLAKGLPIVSIEWLKSNQLGTVFKDPWLHILKDVDGEKQFGFTLKKSLNVSKSKKVFEGLSFFITPHVTPPPDVLEDAISCGGGNVLKVSKFISKDTFIVSCIEDKEQWKVFKSMAIVSTEFIMTGILKQTLLPNSFTLNT